MYIFYFLLKWSSNSYHQTFYYQCIVAKQLNEKRTIEIGQFEIITQTGKSTYHGWLIWQLKPKKNYLLTVLLPSTLLSFSIILKWNPLCAIWEGRGRISSKWCHQFTNKKISLKQTTTFIKTTSLLYNPCVISLLVVMPTNNEMQKALTNIVCPTFYIIALWHS